MPDRPNIHSAYRDRKLFVWAEEPETHPVEGQRLPFSASPARIGRVIEDLKGERAGVELRTSTIWLPTRAGVPVGPSEPTAETAHTSVIRPWRLSTAVLGADEAFQFLEACGRTAGKRGLAVRFAPSTRFWIAALRFAASLALRERFLPSISPENFHAQWQPLIAAPDQYRLTQLARAMPPAARAITAERKSAPEDDPARLLSEFVAWMIDLFPRVIDGSGRYSRSVLREATEWNIDAVWMSRLRSIDSEMRGNRDRLARYCEQIRAWQRPAIRSTRFPWLLSFYLEEPDETAGDNEWKVRYRFEPVPGWPEPEPKTSAVARSLDKQKARVLERAATICVEVRGDTDSFPLDVTGAFRFLTQTANALEQQGFRVVLPDWWKPGARAGDVRARAVVRSPAATGTGTFSLADLMRFDWEVAVGGENFTREELEQLSSAAAPLVKVRGKWVRLEQQNILAALDLWKREAIPARDVIRTALGGAEPPPGVRFEGVRGEGWLGQLLEKLTGESRFEELPVPGGFHGTLRPYQVRGYSWLGFLRQYGLGACLADDMGLGKTIQALALIERDRANGVTRPALIICPTSVVGNWRKETARFAPDLPVLIHHGIARARGSEFAEEAVRHAVVISSYSLVHRDLETLKEIAWSGLILDEAQNIKNPETRQARAARSLTADYRVALTGTPVENNVGELWSIMEFLNPGYLGSAAGFRRRFLLPVQRGDSHAVERLRKLTAPFILRRVKTDRSVVEDLPEKMEMKVFCNLTPEQGGLYQSVVEETTRALETSTGIRRKGIILAALTRLKQVCNHPAQFLGDDSPLPGRSGKLSRLTEMVEELLSEGDRALIFSQFADMGARLQRHLSATFRMEAMFLHGGVPAAKRDEMVDRFQNGDDSGPRLFVLSLKAGGTGLNLTAANHVFHFDRWWNPAVENQATDRAFRIGQKRNVQIHKFVCVGTLEEKIDEMIERKKGIAANVIGAGEAWLTELSTAEIKDLFALRQEAIA